MGWTLCRGGRLENWTSYSGDYSGRRYSELTKIDAKNVKALSLEWLNPNLRSEGGANGVSAAGAGSGRTSVVEIWRTWFCARWCHQLHDG